MFLFSHRTSSSLGCTALDTQSHFRIMRYGGISLISQESMCFNIVYNILTGGARELSWHVIQIEVRGQLVGVLSLHWVGTRDHTQCCLLHGRAFFQPSANPNLHAFKNYIGVTVLFTSVIWHNCWIFFIVMWFKDWLYWYLAMFLLFIKL